MMDNFLFALKDRLNYKTTSKVFNYLSSMDFKYNIYTKGSFHFTFNDYEIEFGEGEEHLFEKENNLKLDGIAKLFGISDSAQIDLTYKLIQPVEYNYNGTIEPKIYTVSNTKLLYSINAFDIDYEYVDRYKKIYPNSYGLSFVIRSFNSRKKEDLLHLLETLKGLSEIINPIFSTHLNSVLLNFFPDDDLFFLPSTFEDIFFFSKDYIEKIGVSIIEKVKGLVDSWEKLENGGIFFIYSKKALIENRLMDSRFEGDQIMSNFIFKEYKKLIK